MPKETLTLQAGSKNKQVQRHSISSPPDPFPLGLHVLPLKLLDRACIQAGPTSSLKRWVAQLIHASLMRAAPHELTCPTPADTLKNSRAV